jgi:hypothetical protein
MKVMNIIVHEEAVLLRASMGFESAKTISEGLDKIKKTEDYLVIKIDEDPRQLHKKMPLPSNELSVIVHGAYKGWCCSYQLDVLKKSGYDANYHPKYVMSAEEY